MESGGRVGASRPLLAEEQKEKLSCVADILSLALVLRGSNHWRRAPSYSMQEARL